MQRPTWLKWPSGSLGVFLILGVLAVGAVTWVGISASNRTASQAANAVAQGEGLADPILRLCAQGGDVSLRLEGAGLCDAAQSVKANPTAAPPPPVTAPQIQSMIDNSLNRRTAPPATAVPTTPAPNPTQIQDMIDNSLRRLPPPQAPPPQQQVAAPAPRYAPPPYYAPPVQQQQQQQQYAAPYAGYPSYPQLPRQYPPPSRGGGWPGGWPGGGGGRPPGGWPPRPPGGGSGSPAGQPGGGSGYPPYQYPNGYPGGYGGGYGGNYGGGYPSYPQQPAPYPYPSYPQYPQQPPTYPQQPSYPTQQPPRQYGGGGGRGSSDGGGVIGSLGIHLG